MTVPCPECGKTEGYEPVGPFRTQCLACGALLKHAEVYPGHTARPPVVTPASERKDS